MKKTYIIPQERSVELDAETFMAQSLQTKPENDAENGTGENGSDQMETKGERSNLWGDNW